jgi:NCS1 family nucleobase:cation symporter-1
MVSLCVATLATNIAANVVSPANDFAHLWPSVINFRVGGFITGLIGILMQPWRLVADPNRYFEQWLIAYSALLGAVGGVLIADYFAIRRTQLDLPGLYRRNSQYWYTGGFHVAAIVAMLLGIAPCVPGFIAHVSTTAAEQIPTFWYNLYHYAWFISFGVSFVAYLVLMSLRGTKSA